MPFAVLLLAPITELVSAAVNCQDGLSLLCQFCYRYTRQCGTDIHQQPLHHEDLRVRSQPWFNPQRSRVFSWYSRAFSTSFRFAATLIMLVCLSLCIRVITSLVVNVPTYSLFTCTWIPCRFCWFSHCENGSFGSRPPSAVHDPISTK